MEGRRWGMAGEGKYLWGGDMREGPERWNEGRVRGRVGGNEEG